MDAFIQLTDDISEADALLALQPRLKKKNGIQAAAKTHDIPIYMTKTSSLEQITKALRALVNDQENNLKDFASEDKINLSEKIDALEEARIAIEQVVIPKGETVELLPRSSHILSLQADLIHKYQLQSEKIGKAPEVRIRIFPFQARMNEDRPVSESVNEDGGFDDFVSTDGDTNGSLYSVERLPLLPD